jgi:general secretion pathway protein D
MFDKKIYSLILISLFITIAGCSEFRNIDEVREEERENIPSRDDSWFDSLGLNDIDLGYDALNKEDDIDPYGSLSREDYKRIGKNRNFDIRDNNSKIELPNVEDLLEEPEEVGIADDKLVSISINDNIPIKEVLLELARKAEVDVEIDNDIQGSIIMIARNKPFSEVIRRIAKKADLKYSFEDGILKIEKDKPLIKQYKFNILDITRSSESSVSSNFSVGGGAGGEGSTASITSGSTSSLETKSGEGDLWTTVEAGISEIITKYGISADAAAQAGAGAGGGGDVSTILSVNRNAGIISILATEKQHKAVKQYLDGIHISLSSQVLIEAKVMEVELNDRYNSGINWSSLVGGANGVYLGNNFGASAATLETGGIAEVGENQFKFSILPQNIFSGDGSLDASVELLEQFGVTRSLSNPRISTMNNQYAVLNFSQNEVYFEVTLEEEEDEDGGGGTDTTLTVESEIKTVPIGIILALQPSIDLMRNEITMNIRPTLTRIAGRVDDPGVTIIASRNNQNIENLNSSIPIVEVREIDTVLKIDNSEIMVIGGLLEERVDNDDSGVPGVSKVPYLGNAFKSVNKETNLVETVIFIKATIVPGSGVTVEDKDFYKKFTKGKEKFNFNIDD